MSLELSRRDVLARLGMAMLAGAAPLPLGAEPSSTGERWISAKGDSSDTFGLAWVDGGATGGVGVTTGFRGHAVLQHPRRPESVVFIGRRPGTRGLEVDLSSGELVGDFQCAPDRHLYGHGCFSAAGDVLFTTESAISSGEGRIVLRDADTYRVLDEWPSHGVGPHDIRLMPNGRQLVVANGGILTRPASGRERLNLDTMRSSLAYLDAQTGALQDTVRLEEPKASIRHLDVAADGTVAFAMQFQRDAAGHDRTVALARVHSRGQPARLLEAPAPLMAQLKDYVGSVAICDETRLAGFTSPRGSLAVFWQIDTGELAGYHALRDVCGIAATPGRPGFVLSNSLGEMRELDGRTLSERRDRRLKRPGYRWDNHLLITDVA